MTHHKSVSNHHHCIHLYLPKSPQLLVMVIDDPCSDKSGSVDMLTLEMEVQDLIDRVTVLEQGHAEVLNLQRSILKKQDQILSRLTVLERQQHDSARPQWNDYSFDDFSFDDSQQPPPYIPPPPLHPPPVQPPPSLHPPPVPVSYTHLTLPTIYSV